MFKDIPENIKIIITSSAPLIVVLVLAFFVGNFGISKITDIRSQIDQAQAAQNVLTQKLNILQTVSATIGSSPDFATTALPSGNSTLITISQLRSLAQTNSVTLSNIKAGAEVKDPSGLSAVDISVDVTGTREQIVNYLESTTNFAPVTTVNSVKMNESAGAAKATVTIRTFWSPLPTTLPAVTASLSDLTPSEKNTIASVSGLIQPAFSVLPAAPGGKTDPFSP